MLYERCKCGLVEVWSSGEPPMLCTPCEKCGAVPATHPSLHPEPVAHEFSMVESVDTDEGPMTLHRCKYCLRTPAQVEERVKKRRASEDK